MQVNYLPNNKMSLSSSQKYPSNINTLPTEILLEVFSHLSLKALRSLALVSCRFRDIVRQLVLLKFRFTFTECGTYEGPIGLALSGTSYPDAIEFKLTGTGERWEASAFDMCSSSQYSFRLLRDCMQNLRKIKYIIHDSYCMLDYHFCLSPLCLNDDKPIEELGIFHTYGNFCLTCLDNFLAAFTASLTVLDFFYQTVTDDEMEIIFRWLPNLTRLSVSGCLGVTDAGLEKISNLKNLQKLELFKVKGVTNQSMCYFQLPCLVELEFSKFERVNEMGLAQLVKGCPKLRQVYLFECKSFSDKCVEVLLRGLPNLQHLRIEGCPNFTAKCKKLVKELCPRPVIGIYLGEDKE